MARRKAHPRENEEARFIASRIQDARRRGKTNREIGEAFGINERTVRKIIAGETSGKRIYKARVEKAPPGASPSIVRLDMLIGYDDAGKEVVRTTNAKVPALTSAKGRRVAPTPFDVFRLPDLSSVALAESIRFARQYGNLVRRTAPLGTISTIRPIVRRNPNTRLVTVKGEYR